MVAPGLPITHSSVAIPAVMPTSAVSDLPRFAGAKRLALGVTQETDRRDRASVPAVGDEDRADGTAEQAAGMTAAQQRPLSQREHEVAVLLRGLSDDEVAAHVTNRIEHLAYPIEMQRRLVAALKDFKQASDLASSRLLGATCVLVVLTVVIAVLTIVLIVR